MRARVHHPLIVGDVIGDREVIAVGDRLGKRADECVSWRCACGREGKSYAFNLRTGTGQCQHPEGKMCKCGHPVGDHRRRGGACLEDECECVAFTKIDPLRDARDRVSAVHYKTGPRVLCGQFLSARSKSSESITEVNCKVCRHFLKQVEASLKS